MATKMKRPGQWRPRVLPLCAADGREAPPLGLRRGRGIYHQGLQRGRKRERKARQLRQPLPIASFLKVKKKKNNNKKNNKNTTATASALLPPRRGGGERKRCAPPQAGAYEGLVQREGSEAAEAASTELARREGGGSLIATTTTTTITTTRNKNNNKVPQSACTRVLAEESSQLKAHNITLFESERTCIEAALRQLPRRRRFLLKTAQLTAFSRPRASEARVFSVCFEGRLQKRLTTDLASAHIGSACLYRRQLQCKRCRKPTDSKPCGPTRTSPAGPTKHSKSCSAPTRSIWMTCPRGTA